jgi:hypothetical protein
MSWYNRIHDRSLGYSANDLTPTVRSVFADMAREKSVDLSNLGHVNPVHLAVVLRATFTQKDSVRGWDEAVVVARKTGIEDGLDPTDFLYGFDL